MEIRIANIEPEFVAMVKADAKRNARTIAMQALYILRQHYAARGKEEKFSAAKEEAVSQGAEKTWKFDQ